MTFHLQIVTPDGKYFDGQAVRLIIPTMNGQVGILARHINYVTPLGMGRATVLANGQKRYAACIGGMLSVVNGEVTLVPTTFEWADQIDVNRADLAQKKAEDRLKASNTDTEVRLAQAKLHRALVRKSMASYK